MNAPLPRNLVLLAQIVALGMIGHDVPGSLHGVFLPFLPWLDVFHASPLYERALAGLLYVSLVLVIVNRWTRMAAITAGLTLLLALLSSRAYYKNDLVYCAAILFMVGVSDRNGWFPRLQVSLVYGAAALNKALDAEWWSGRFFDALIEVVALTPYMVETNYLWFPDAYLRLSSFLPELLLSQCMSAMVIFTEFALAVGLLLARTRRLMVVVGLLFHATLTIVIGESFGVFFYAMCASYLAFVTWPEQALAVHCHPASRHAQALKWFAELGRACGEVRCVPTLRVDSIAVEANGRWLVGMAAARRALMRMPRTYYVIALLMIAPSWGYLVSYDLWGMGFWARTYLILVLAGFLLPLATRERTREPSFAPRPVHEEAS